MGFSDLKIKSGGKFFRVEAGQPRDIRILQDTPSHRDMHGFGAGAQECEGDDCEKCLSGDDAKERFSINIYDHAQKKVMLWEFGAGVAKQLKKIAMTAIEDGKNIMDFDLKVESEGSGLQKKYMITARMTSKVVPSDLKLYSLAGDVPF